MRKGTSEYALMVLFDLRLQAHHPLGTENKLCNPCFPLNFSFVYGDSDWVRSIDLDYARYCVESN